LEVHRRPVVSHGRALFCPDDLKRTRKRPRHLEGDRLGQVRL